MESQRQHFDFCNMNSIYGEGKKWGSVHKADMWFFCVEKRSFSSLYVWDLV